MLILNVNMLKPMWTFRHIKEDVFICTIILLCFHCVVSLLVQGFECNLGLRARVNGYKLHEAKPSAIMPFTSAIIPNCTRKHAIVHKPCYKLTVHYNKYEYV